MPKVFNRARMTTATTGTGTVTLGSAVSGYQSFSSAGVANSDVVHYVIEDGTAWEIGTGTYTSAGTTLSRTLVQSSTGSLLSLSGTAEVFITAPASAFAGRLLRAPQILTSGTSYTTPNDCTGIYVELVGGGGNGRAPGASAAAGGGGGGAYAAKFFTVAASTAYTYAIGSAAGNTTFTVGATTVTAGGGATATGASGGSGGTATNGDINIAGATGGTGLAVATTSTTYISGAGGDSVFGSGGVSASAAGVSVANGVGGTGYGAGGSGGVGTTGTGGAGTGGVIRIWEFA